VACVCRVIARKDRLRCWKKWRWKRSCISRRQLCQWTNTGRCWRMCHCRQNSKRKISWNTLRTRIAGTSTCRYVPPECFLTSSLTSMQGGIVCRWEVAGRGSTSELTRAFITQLFPLSSIGVASVISLSVAKLIEDLLPCRGIRLRRCQRMTAGCTACRQKFSRPGKFD